MYGFSLLPFALCALTFFCCSATKKRLTTERTETTEKGTAACAGKGHASLFVDPQFFSVCSP